MTFGAATLTFGVANLTFGLASAHLGGVGVGLGVCQSRDAGPQGCHYLRYCACRDCWCYQCHCCCYWCHCCNNNCCYHLLSFYVRILAKFGVATAAGIATISAATATATATNCQASDCQFYPNPHRPLTLILPQPLRHISLLLLLPLSRLLLLLLHTACCSRNYYAHCAHTAEHHARQHQAAITHIMFS